MNKLPLPWCGCGGGLGEGVLVKRSLLAHDPCSNRSRIPNPKGGTNLLFYQVVPKTAWKWRILHPERIYYVDPPPTWTLSSLKTSGNCQAVYWKGESRPRARIYIPMVSLSAQVRTCSTVTPLSSHLIAYSDRTYVGTGPGPGPILCRTPSHI